MSNYVTFLYLDSWHQRVWKAVDVIFNLDLFVFLIWLRTSELLNLTYIGSRNMGRDIKMQYSKTFNIAITSSIE